MKNREKLAKMSNKELAEWFDSNKEYCCCELCAFRENELECEKHKDCVVGLLL